MRAMKHLSLNQLAHHAATIVHSQYAGTDAAHDIEESLDSHTGRRVRAFTGLLQTRVRAYLIHKLVPADTLKLPAHQRWHETRKIIGTHLDNKANVKALKPIIDILAYEIAAEYRAEANQ